MKCKMPPARKTEKITAASAMIFRSGRCVPASAVLNAVSRNKERVSSAEGRWRISVQLHFLSCIGEAFPHLQLHYSTIICPFQCGIVILTVNLSPVFIVCRSAPLSCLLSYVAQKRGCLSVTMPKTAAKAENNLTNFFTYDKIYPYIVS